MSQGTQASGASRLRIETSLAHAVKALGASLGALAWTGMLYQLANRLAHLRWLREHGVSACIVLVGFVSDADMRGIGSDAEWQGALQVAWRTLGLSPRHALSRFILEAFPPIADLR